MLFIPKFGILIKIVYYCIILNCAPMYKEILNQTKKLYPNIRLSIEGLVIKTEIINSNNKIIRFDHTCQNEESLLKEIPIRAKMMHLLQNDGFKNKIPQ